MVEICPRAIPRKKRHSLNPVTRESRRSIVTSTDPDDPHPSDTHPLIMLYNNLTPLKRYQTFLQGVRTASFVHRNTQTHRDEVTRCESPTESETYPLILHYNNLTPLKQYQDFLSNARRDQLRVGNETGHNLKKAVSDQSRSESVDGIDSDDGTDSEDEIEIGIEPHRNGTFDGPMIEPDDETDLIDEVETDIKLLDNGTSLIDVAEPGNGTGLIDVVQPDIDNGTGLIDKVKPDSKIPDNGTSVIKVVEPNYGTELIDAVKPDIKVPVNGTGFDIKDIIPEIIVPNNESTLIEVVEPDNGTGSMDVVEPDNEKNLIDVEPDMILPVNETRIIDVVSQVMDETDSSGIDADGDWAELESGTGTAGTNPTLNQISVITKTQ